MTSGIFYRGKPIEELSREELLECVISLSKSLEDAYELHAQTMRIWDLFDRVGKQGMSFEAQLAHGE